LRQRSGGQQKRTPLVAVLGAINWDVSIFEERFPVAGEEVPVSSVEEFPGGKGANAAVAAARILGSWRVALLGCLGDDPIARRQLAALRREGVLTAGVLRKKGQNSGRAYVVVDGVGRKTIHTLFGANDALTPRDLRGRGPAGIIAGSKVLVVMDSTIDVALAAARAARAEGIPLVYSPCVRAKDGAEALEGVLALSDYLVLDVAELANLCPGMGEKKGLRLVARRHPGLAVIETRGDEGCLVANGERLDSVRAVDLAALGKKAVNTTGSGDAFLGALAAFLAEGFGLRDSLRRASIAGALKAAARETRGSPGRAELESALESLGT
jgi:ribokinase